jgi:putative phosphoribosyl transferase
MRQAMGKDRAIEMNAQGQDRGRTTAGRDVEIADGSVRLAGTLTVPSDPVGTVLFAHGSGSSRFSPRNMEVARRLHDARFGTLLFDLLTEAEAADRSNVFAVELLAGRLGAATRWLREEPEGSLPMGYFGASTGAAAALWAAPEFGDSVAAIVSRGGRPDLAGPRLGNVSAPTLLIVGELDHLVLDLNREAFAALRCEKDLVVISGATHLFEERGALEQVAGHATSWFGRHLIEAPGPEGGGRR